MLYLCATPIGNLEDITYRAVRVLSEVSCIFAEDTRHSLGLLQHYGIKKPLYSCHEHNEAQRAEEIVALLRAGEDVAYISDAGMPCVSDPGYRLVCACIDNGMEYTVLPGASASVTALALSGISTREFTFFGFLPRSGKERANVISRVIHSYCTTIIYESPNRVCDTLRDLAKHDESRVVSVVREITKLHEEAVRMPISALIERYTAIPPKGECVIVISAEEQRAASQNDIDELICEQISSGMCAKSISRAVAQQLGIAKNDVYKRVLELTADASDDADDANE